MLSLQKGLLLWGDSCKFAHVGYQQRNKSDSTSTTSTERNWKPACTNGEGCSWLARGACKFFHRGPGGSEAGPDPAQTKPSQRLPGKSPPKPPKLNVGFSPSQERKPANEKERAKELNDLVVVENRYSILTNENSHSDKDLHDRTGDKVGSRKTRTCVNKKHNEKKSPIRKTKNLSTDADSSTDTTVGWTKTSQKPKFFEKRKKSSKMQKLKNI